MDQKRDPMKVNFDSFQIQKWILQKKRVDEKIGLKVDEIR